MDRRIQPLSLLLFALDMAIVILALLFASELRTVIPLGRGGALRDSQTRVPILIYGLAAVSWGFGLISAGAYHPQLSLRWFMEAIRVVWGALIGTGIMAGILYMSFRELSRLQFLYFFLIGVGLVLGYRASLRLYYRLIGRSRAGRNRILILGAGSLGRRVAKVLLDHSRWGFHPVGLLDDDPSKVGEEVRGLPVLGSIDELKGCVIENNIDEIWVALPASSIERLGEVVESVQELPVRIKVVPDYFAFALIRTKPEVLGSLPVIGLRDPLIEGVPRMVKRAFDVAVTVLVMPIAVPLMGLIALLIRIDSKGAVLFTQKRVGENGRPFRMLKFRTMVAGTEKEEVELPAKEGDGQLHKRRDDPRVTRVGGLLRRFSLDELPQLFNVLKGEMSLVGPRPELPSLVDRYEAWQRKRFAVPQGITGWWQINGRSDRPMHLHTEDDLYYVYNYSLWLDVLILLRTPWVVLRGWGAF